MDDDPQAPVFTSWDDTPPEEPEESAQPPAPIAPAEVDFLTPPLPNSLLLGGDIYRPSGAIALVLLIGPTVCAIIGAIGASATGVIPLWLPLALLAWLPILALVWALLKSVRVTTETLACGRPLGAWRSIPFSEIERVEQRGLRMIAQSRMGERLSFTPSLLRRGANLRRSLLLQLPLYALAGDLHAEAIALEGNGMPVSDESSLLSALTVRVARRWSALAFVTALLALVGAALAAWLLAAPPSLALGVALLALAGALGFLGAWAAQEIVISEHGMFIHYRMLRRDRDIFWSQVRLLEYTPGELALRFRGEHDVVCAGPGLFTTAEARRLREYIQRYSEAQITPLLARHEG